MLSSMVTVREDKVRENKLRRMAHRQGLTLVKSRRRDTRALDYGTYALMDPRDNAVALSGHESGYGLTLDDVEARLTQ